MDRGPPVLHLSHLLWGTRRPPSQAGRFAPLVALRDENVDRAQSVQRLLSQRQLSGVSWRDAEVRGTAYSSSSSQRLGGRSPWLPHLPRAVASSPPGARFSQITLCKR